MSAVQIAGCSGAGKTTIAAVLARRGLAVIDADDDPLLARTVDTAGNVVEEAPEEPDFAWLSRHSWAWDPARLDELIAAAAPAMLYVCGGADNQLELAGRFTQVFLLEIDEPTMLARLDARRDYHDWGRIGDTREYLRRKLPELQDCLRASGAIPIDARQPLDQVVDAILSRTLASSAASRASKPRPLAGQHRFYTTVRLRSRANLTGDEHPVPDQHNPPARRTRAPGDRARARIAGQAAGLATIEGLDGLSIGRLAEITGVPKSSVHALFGSKEELQLATVNAARESFIREVVGPALSAAQPGRDRLLALCDGYLSYVQRRIFPGGCFFVAASAEVGARAGRVHDEVARVQQQWRDLLSHEAGAAADMGQLAEDTDPAQLAFELGVILAGTNIVSVLHDDTGAIMRARTAIRSRLSR